MQANIDKIVAIIFNQSSIKVLFIFRAIFINWQITVIQFSTAFPTADAAYIIFSYSISTDHKKLVESCLKVVKAFT